MIYTLTFSITSSIVIFVCLATVLIILFYYLCLNNFLGYIGEKYARKELAKLPLNKYITINNLLIKVDDTTHEIDHVVVSPYGIFVVETKQYNGFITGDKYDVKWVMHGRNRKQYYYTNPFRQNYGHIKSLSKLLELDEKLFIGIVYIPSSARLKITRGEEIVRYGLDKKILSYQNILIENYVEIANKLKTYNLMYDNYKKEHISNIRHNYGINYNKCPKCGSDLVLRTSKYGKFYGCSNYPRCKYTKRK